MKLFQKLLLGPAAIGLLSPIAVNASEANFKDTNDYSQNDIEVSIDTFKPLSSKNPLLAGGEGINQNNGSSDFDVDSFSSTTSASFESNFVAAAIDTGDFKRSYSGYDYKISLSTSFSGDDSLDVEFEAGNTSNIPELDLGSDGDGIKVDSISYTKSLGDKLTVFFGDGAPGSSLYNTACAYNGVTDALDDCGNLNSAIDAEFGTAFGLSADLSSGFTAAIGVETQNTGTGAFTDESADAFGAQLSYTGDNFGVSLTWANIEDTTLAVLDSDQGATQSAAINAYFDPDFSNFPSISVGFESNHDDSAALTDANDESTHYFVGLQWDELGNGSFGAALGSKTPTAENGEAQVQYEAFYSYNYADGITVTPLFYSRENTGSRDDSGIIIKTTFEF